MALVYSDSAVPEYNLACSSGSYASQCVGEGWDSFNADLADRSFKNIIENNHLEELIQHTAQQHAENQTIITVCPYIVTGIKDESIKICTWLSL